MKSLQAQFVECKGGVLEIGGLSVIQRDKVPITSGVVTVRFIASRPDSPAQGVQLYAGKDGVIIMSDGSVTERMDIWHRPHLPDNVEHRVYCPDGFLSVHNRYEVHLKDGRVIEEHWTGNAGMTVKQLVGACRRYACSDGFGEFRTDDLVFDIEWNEKPNEDTADTTRVTNGAARRLRRLAMGSE